MLIVRAFMVISFQEHRSGATLTQSATRVPVGEIEKERETAVLSMRAGRSRVTS
jgi:hypothetical protein